VCTIETPKQIAEDMEAMKRRHLEMVQELEENYQTTAREKQVRRSMGEKKGPDTLLVMQMLLCDQEWTVLRIRLNHSEENPGPLPGEGGEKDRSGMLNPPLLLVSIISNPNNSLSHFFLITWFTHLATLM